MSEPVIVQAVLSLAAASFSRLEQQPEKKKKKQLVRVLYIGTATYDLPGPRQRQTQAFVATEQCNCLVQCLEVAHGPLTNEGIAMVETADILLVSGGNTLYAMDRWKQCGLDEHLRRRILSTNANDIVLTGGSAGAICWFDGGHSDSADPETWKERMMMTMITTTMAAPATSDESSAAPVSKADTQSWEYVRVQGLGFLPGLVCPHHDKIQSNGVLRATDFDQMLLRHAGEVGIGIDHWAALQVDGDSFTVVSIPGKEGSVLPNGEFSPDRQGKPGIWIKTVENGKVCRRLCPPSGKLSEILFPADEIVLDPREDECRKQNPADF